MLQFTDLKQIILDEEEVLTIKKYTEKMFPSERVNQYSSQFQYDNISILNPNYIGILGEWAYYKKYGDLTLEQYLEGRVTFHSDKGDGILGSGATVDIKTSNSTKGVNKYNIVDWRVTVEKKHLDKEFIDIFIFNVKYGYSNEIPVQVLGWIERDSFLQYADYYEAGDEIGSFKVKGDCYMLPATYLRSIDSLPFNTIDFVK